MSSSSSSPHGNGNGKARQPDADYIDNRARAPYDYGGNPLTHAHTLSDETDRLAAFGGAFQPGLYKPPKTNVANPAPLGLCGFALTTFLLSLINLGTCNLSNPAIVIAPAFVYGGLIQLLAGMWEIALGNTYAGTALSSYGGFWIGTAIILTPGGFRIVETLGGEGPQFYNEFGLYLMGWFLFTFIIWLLTLRSTVAFCSLLLFVWLTFLMLGIGYLDYDAAGPNVPLTRAGGAFGIIAAFLAWYNAFAGLADPSNSFFLVPVIHFPWSEKGRERRKASLVKADEEKTA